MVFAFVMGLCNYAGVERGFTNFTHKHPAHCNDGSWQWPIPFFHPAPLPLLKFYITVSHFCWISINLILNFLEKIYSCHHSRITSAINFQLFGSRGFLTKELCKLKIDFFLMLCSIIMLFSQHLACDVHSTEITSVRITE